MDFLNTLKEILLGLVNDSGFATGDWKNYVMIGLSLVLIYLAIAKKFEPLLLLPIAFGMLLSNLPGAGLYNAAFFEGGHVDWAAIGSGNAGLLDILYVGVKLGIYPCIIFVGIGAMTDFSSLIANPKALLMGAGAQLGIFVAFAGALLLGQIPGIGFTMNDAASIGIIGGADGPTAIFVTRLLSPELLGPIAIAAYSYMALIPAIQKPIMRALTTKKERAIKMSVLRPVSQTEKIVFPIMVTILIALFLPSAAPLIGCLMFGNLIKESGVCDRLVKTASNELMNIVTIFLGLSVGATATADNFLTLKTLGIVGMGVVAFALGTTGGLLVGKLMCVLTGGKINPLIGSAGVSAVPMAARVSQAVGAEEDPTNFLLMHAMGPNVAGVIGSAVAAGVFISVLG